MPDRWRGCYRQSATRLIVHPNVVNASDINEMPENALYVEGSVICRLLMGTAGLQRVRSNRVLVVIDRHEEIAYSNAAINAVNAARACYGFDCPRIVMLDPPVKLVSEYTSTGRAAGRVDNLSEFLDGIRPYLPEADAIAVSSVIARSAGIPSGLLRQRRRDGQPLGWRRGHFHSRAFAPVRHAHSPLSHDRIRGNRVDRSRHRRPAEWRPRPSRSRSSSRSSKG